MDLVRIVSINYASVHLWNRTKFETCNGFEVVYGAINRDKGSSTSVCHSLTTTKLTQHTIDIYM